MSYMAAHNFDPELLRDSMYVGGINDCVPRQIDSWESEK